MRGAVIVSVMAVCLLIGALLQESYHYCQHEVHVLPYQTPPPERAIWIPGVFPQGLTVKDEGGLVVVKALPSETWGTINPSDTLQVMMSDGRTVRLAYGYYVKIVQ